MEEEKIPKTKPDTSFNKRLYVAKKLRGTWQWPRKMSKNLFYRGTWQREGNMAKGIMVILNRNELFVSSDFSELVWVFLPYLSF